jgi:TetR/AcrR family transcriptional regulator, mexJK operon transcriptional repressor
MELTREKPALGRREARRLDRREAIIAVAYASFLEHGYAATTMSGIAATIGGSKATLWSYFPSKEALFEAVLDTATSAYRAQLSTLLDTSVDPESTIRSFCTSFLNKVTTPEALALQRLAHGEAGRFPEMGTAFYERGPRTTQTMLAGFISSAMDRGLLRRDDPMRAARTLSSLCMSGCHQQLLFGRIDAVTPEMIAADADAATELFLRAYAPLS